MASHSIAKVLHCEINPTFNDGTISNPQIVLESLLSTIKAVENGNGREPPARREETYSSIGGLLGGRHLDSITIVFAAITDGRVSKCVFRTNGCCTLLPDVAACHSSPGHYMGTLGPLWFGEQDGLLSSALGSASVRMSWAYAMKTSSKSGTTEVLPASPPSLTRVSRVSLQQELPALGYLTRPRR
ncbi:hypothetical protein Purlil1_14344 [Purpureocillium lilacinum]|uniref:Uncharacterized protein n=1 Tax=Purpureocillium lilacinum TaxID=33203 RepID=A0ABR0BBJ0_PURLI|nr:hypothetical protein Purlil1_14344 [Purpureocillium lilacinum]